MSYYCSKDKLKVCVHGVSGLSRHSRPLNQGFHHESALAQARLLSGVLCERATQYHEPLGI
jgi:hypothetical protein